MTNFKRITLFTLVPLLVSGCVTLARQVNLNSEIKLNSNEGILVLPRNFIGSDAQVTFVEKNTGWQFKVGFISIGESSPAFVVEAGTYCLSSRKIKEEFGSEKRYVTLDYDGKSQCFNVYPGKISRTIFPLP